MAEHASSAGAVLEALGLAAFSRDGPGQLRLEDSVERRDDRHLVQRFFHLRLLRDSSLAPPARD